MITAQKTIRFPLEVHEAVVKAVEKRGDISENKWIIEACQEKAAREAKRKTRSV